MTHNLCSLHLCHLKKIHNNDSRGRDVDVLLLLRSCYGMPSAIKGI
jgi:hypothetical protein